MSFKVGDRVQSHPGTNAWMSGDRYGDVVKVARTGTVSVKMDRSGRVKKFSPHNLILVEGVLFGGRGGGKRRSVTRRRRVVNYAADEAALKAAIRALKEAMKG